VILTQICRIRPRLTRRAVAVAQRHRAPAEVSARIGNSARVLHDTYLHRIDSHQDLVSQRIEDALDADPGSWRPPPCGKQAVIRTVGTTQDPVRYMYADLPADPPAAHDFLLQQTRAGTVGHPVSRLFPQFRGHLKRYRPKPGDGRIQPHA
jgi:hypothetical protein